MSFTTTLTSKNQFTLPKLVRDKLGLKRGAKIDIFPTLDGSSFIGRPKRKSDILKFAGNLANLDDGKSWQEIREETEKLAAQELVTRFKDLTQSKDAKLYRIKFNK